MEKHIKIKIRAQEVADAALLAYYNPHDEYFAKRLADALAALDGVSK